jgi:hypothetical protein
MRKSLRGVLIMTPPKSIYPAPSKLCGLLMGQDILEGGVNAEVLFGPLFASQGNSKGLTGSQRDYIGLLKEKTILKDWSERKNLKNLQKVV